MALKPTIYKVNLQLSDMNKHCYESLSLTVAQHPSETLTRMMVRVLVYGLNYHRDLSFTKGLSATDEPELWQVSPSGEVENWIELGQVSPDRLRKGVSRAQQISLYAYGSETEIWWQKHQQAITQLPKVNVWQLPAAQLEPLEAMVKRTMDLSLMITDDTLMLSSDDQHCEVTLQQLS